MGNISGKDSGKQIPKRPSRQRSKDPTKLPRKESNRSYRKRSSRSTRAYRSSRSGRRPVLRPSTSIEIPSSVEFIKNWEAQTKGLKKDEGLNKLFQRTRDLAVEVEKQVEKAVSQKRDLPLRYFVEVEKACLTILSTCQSKVLCGKALFILMKIITNFYNEWRPSEDTRKLTLEKLYHYADEFIRITPEPHIIAVKRKSLSVDSVEFNSLGDIIGFHEDVEVVCNTINPANHQLKLGNSKSDILKEILKKVRVKKARGKRVDSRNEILKRIKNEFDFTLEVFYDQNVMKYIHILQACLAILNQLCLKGVDPPLYHKMKILESLSQDKHAAKLFKILRNQVKDTGLEQNLFGFLVSCGRKGVENHEFDPLAVGRIRHLAEHVDGMRQFIHQTYKNVGCLGTTKWHLNLGRLNEMIKLNPERVDSFVERYMGRQVLDSEKDVVYGLSSTDVLRHMTYLVNSADRDNEMASYFNLKHANDTLRECNYDLKKAKEVVKFMNAMKNLDHPIAQNYASQKIRKFGSAEKALREEEIELSRLAVVTPVAQTVPLPAPVQMVDGIPRIMPRSESLPTKPMPVASPNILVDFYKTKQRGLPQINSIPQSLVLSPTVTSEVVQNVARMIMFTCSPKILSDEGEISELGLLDFNREKTSIVDALRQGRYDVEFQTSVLTADNLFSSTANIFHLSGHGLPNRLIVEDGWAGMRTLLPNQVAELRSNEIANLQLVFVSTCHSGNIGRLLVNVGVPHVVAVMNDHVVQDSRAADFSRYFYKFLFEGWTIQKAFQRACQFMKVHNSDVFELLPKPDEKDIESDYHEKTLQDLLGVPPKKLISPSIRIRENSIPCSRGVTRGVIKSLMVHRSRTSIPIFRAIHYLSKHRRMILHSVAGQGRSDLSVLIAREMRRLRRPTCSDGVILVEFGSTVGSVQEFAIEIIEALDRAMYYEQNPKAADYLYFDGKPKPPELKELQENPSFDKLSSYLHNRNILLMLTTPNLHLDEYYDWFPAGNAPLARNIALSLLELLMRPCGSTCLVISPESREVLHSIFSEATSTKAFFNKTCDIAVPFFTPREAKEYLLYDGSLPDNCKELTKRMTAMSDEAFAKMLPLAAILLEKISYFGQLGVPWKEMRLLLKRVARQNKASLQSCIDLLKKKSYYENLGEQIEQWLLDVFEMWKWNDLYKNDSWKEGDYQGDQRKSSYEKESSSRPQEVSFDWLDEEMLDRLNDFWKQREYLLDKEIVEFIIDVFKEITPEQAKGFVKIKREGFQPRPLVQQKGRQREFLLAKEEFETELDEKEEKVMKLRTEFDAKSKALVENARKTSGGSKKSKTDLADFRKRGAMLNLKNSDISQANAKATMAEKEVAKGILGPPRSFPSWELQTRSQSTDCDGLSAALQECGYTLLSSIYDIEPPYFYSGCILNNFSNIRALIWSYLDVTFELVLPFTDILTILRGRFSSDISKAIIEFLGIDKEELFVIHGSSQYSDDSYLCIHPTHRVSSSHIGVYVKHFSKYVLISSESAICSMYLDEERHSLSTLVCQKGYLMHMDTLMSDTSEDLLEYRAFLEEAKKKKENEEKLPKIFRSLKAVKHIQKGQDSSLRCLTANIPLSMLSTGRISFEFFNEDNEVVVKTADYMYEDDFMSIVDVMSRRKCLKCDSFIIRNEFEDQSWMSWLWNTSYSAEFGPFSIINTHSEIERDSRSESTYSIWVHERVEMNRIDSNEQKEKFGKRKLGAVLSVFKDRNIGRAVDEVIRFEKALKRAGYTIFKSKGRKEAPVSCCKEDVDQFITKAKSFKWDGVFCMLISHGYNDNKSGLDIPTVVMEGGHDLSIAKFIKLLAGMSFPVIVAANFCRINAVEIDASEPQMGLAEVSGEVFLSLGSRSGACATEHDFVSLWRRMLNSDFTEDVIGAVAQEVKRQCGGSYADGLTIDFPCIGGVFCTEDDQFNY